MTGVYPWLVDLPIIKRFQPSVETVGEKGILTAAKEINCLNDVARAVTPFKGGKLLCSLLWLRWAAGRGASG